MEDFNKRYVTFSRPFIMALKEIYRTMLGTEITPGPPRLRKDRVSLGHYTSVMGMNGGLTEDGKIVPFRGSFILSWSLNCYLKTAGAMLMDTYTEITDEISDVGSEIANQTMGNAKKVLITEGYKIEMSIPSSFMGVGQKIKGSDSVVSIMIPFSSDFGEMFMEIAYSDERPS